MSTINLILSESYRVPLHNNIVTIETVENVPESDVPQYHTTVCWGSDPDEDVLLQSFSREEAIERHERLCRSFRKYQWFWKPVLIKESVLAD